MHFYILGIGGVFMGNLALLLRDRGHQVSGCDSVLYPPMCDLLFAQGICVHSWQEGLHALSSISSHCVFVVGNSISRGNRLLEYILNHNLDYISGPQLLYQQVLHKREVLAVAGTHGKTTVSSMMAHIFWQQGIDAGWLIGGACDIDGTGRGSRLGSDQRFVIEADEYDSCVSDKRAKFLHYRPRYLLINNLEFDHADIYPNLAAIETQFHHLIRSMPANGYILVRDLPVMQRVLAQGVWTKVVFLDQLWTAKNNVHGVCIGRKNNGNITWHRLDWHVEGMHNVDNAIVAVALAHTCGVPWKKAVDALGSFHLPKRRLELIGQIHVAERASKNVHVVGVEKRKHTAQIDQQKCYVYTDFAHHPTAIKKVIRAMRVMVEKQKNKCFNEGNLLVVLHPASNTMRSDRHNHVLVHSLAGTDQLWLYAPEGQDTKDVHTKHMLLQNQQAYFLYRGVYVDAKQLSLSIKKTAKRGDFVLTISNGSIALLHQHLLD